MTFVRVCRYEVPIDGLDGGRVVTGRHKCGVSWENRRMMVCSEGIGSWVVLTFFFNWQTRKGFGLHLNLFFLAF